MHSTTSTTVRNIVYKRKQDFFKKTRCFQKKKIHLYGWYVLKRGTTWNDLERPETTYNEQETIWNDLQWARNNLKGPATSKKRPERVCNEQETTWNYLQQAKNDLKRPTTSKKLPEMILQRVRYNLKRPKLTYNEQKNFCNIVHRDMNFLIKLFKKHQWKQHWKRHFFLFSRHIARAVILVAEDLRS